MSKDKVVIDITTMRDDIILEAQKLMDDDAHTYTNGVLDMYNAIINVLKGSDKADTDVTYKTEG